MAKMDMRLTSYYHQVCSANNEKQLIVIGGQDKRNCKGINSLRSLQNEYKLTQKIFCQDLLNNHTCTCQWLRLVMTGGDGDGH